MNNLHVEVDRGHRAKAFMEEFLEPILADRKSIIFEALMAVDPSDVSRIQALVVTLQAYEAVENDLQSFVDTGKMSAMQLAIN